MCQSPINIAEEILKDLEEIIQYLESAFKEGKTWNPAFGTAIGNLLMAWENVKLEEEASEEQARIACENIHLDIDALMAIART
jgi:hypothetical protein